MNEENRNNTIQSLVYHFVMCSVNWVSSVLIILSIRRVPLKSIFQVKWTLWYYYYYYYYYYFTIIIIINMIIIIIIVIIIIIIITLLLIENVNK